MLARSTLVCRLACLQRPSIVPPTYCVRYLATKKKQQTKLQTSTKPPACETSQLPARPRNWLTQKVESSPTALKVFLKVTDALGYGSAKQIAGRRAFVFYERLCAVRADEEAAFWQDGELFLLCIEAVEYAQNVEIHYIVVGLNDAH